MKTLLFLSTTSTIASLCAPCSLPDALWFVGSVTITFLLFLFHF